ATAMTINLQGRRRQLFENVSILNAHGIVLYAESTNSAQQASDIRLRRVIVGSTQEMTAGSPESDGRAYQSRHVFEMKNGRRVAADGLVFYQANVASENRAAAILLSPRGRAADDPTPIAMRDFSFRDVAIIGSPSCVEHASESRREVNQAPT